MADLQKTVEIIFGGRNELSKVIGDVERSLDSLNTASQPFADMADNVLRTEIAVLGLGVAFAGLSINQAGNFGDQFAEISTLIDTSVSDLGGYRQEILTYANDSTQSLDSINGAVYSAISAGIDYTDALGVMSTAEQLAVAGKADLNSTLVALASVMNAYGASTDEASDYSDIFFTTVKQGQTTIPELAASLSQVTSVAVAAGVPFDDLSAAVAALTAAGMPTSQAITSIKAALSNIIKPSSDAQQAAAELGIEFNTTALKTQGLGGFMQTLHDATGGNIETMGRLFGSTEALSGVMALAADNSGIFADSLEAMETRSGATAIAFEKMVDNFSLNNQRLVNNIKTVLIGVGTPLLDEYRGVIDSLIANLQGIGTALDAGSLDGLIGIFESALSDIDGLLSGVAEVLPEALAGIDWGSLSGSLDNLKESMGDAFSAMFGDIDLSTVEGVEDAIQTIVDLLAGLTNTSAGVIDGMRPLFVFLGELAEHFAEAGEDGQEFAGQILGIGKSVNVITGFLSGATSALGGLSSGLLLLGGGSVLKGISSLVSSLGGGAGLSGVLSAGATSIAAMVARLTPLGIALTAAGTAAYYTVDAYQGMREAQDQATDAEGRALVSAEALADKYLDISTSTGVWVESTNDLKQALEDGTLQISNFTGELVSAEQYSAEFDQAVRAAADASWNLSDAMPEVYEGLRQLGIELDSAGDKIEPVVTEFEKLAAVVRQDMGVETIKGTFSVVSFGAGEVAEKLDDASEATETFKMKMAELATDERISTMELSVDLQIAQIEADSEQAVAAIENIGTAIESTGETMASLAETFAGSMGDFSNIKDKWLLEDMMEQEMDLRKEALEMQKDMNEAQIEYLEAKADALKDGDGIIKIDSSGLEPALEMVLWHILEKVQVKVNQEASEMLVG